ncbi:hypothetical protein A2U01_0058153, partial [Trifolium medium]|nr:hypothetical protein [Trifolium medium]
VKILVAPAPSMSGRYNISYADPARRGEDVVLGFFRFWLSGFSVRVAKSVKERRE